MGNINTPHAGTLINPSLTQHCARHKSSDMIYLATKQFRH